LSCTRPRAGPRALPEDRAEEIGEAAATPAEEIVQVTIFHAYPAGKTTIFVPVEIALATTSLPTRVIAPEPVVMGAFLLIIEDLIRLIDLFESFFSLFIVWVAVGMILHCHFAIGFPNVLFAGIPLHTQNLIVIFVVHNKILLHRVEW
jgi:hypothetical protein